MRIIILPQLWMGGAHTDPTQRQAFPQQNSSAGGENTDEGSLSIHLSNSFKGREGDRICLLFLLQTASPTWRAEICSFPSACCVAREHLDELTGVLQDN